MRMITAKPFFWNTAAMITEGIVLRRNPAELADLMRDMDVLSAVAARLAKPLKDRGNSPILDINRSPVLVSGGRNRGLHV